MLLKYQKSKVLSHLKGKELFFEGNEDVEAFYGTLISSKRDEDTGEILAKIEDQEGNLFDVDMEDIQFNDLEVSSELKNVFNAATSVLTAKEFLNMYYGNKTVEILDNNEETDYKVNNVWSLLKMDGVSLLVSGKHEDAHLIPYYSEYAYHKDAKIVVLMDNDSDTELLDMLLNEKSEEKTISVEEFDKKYSTVLEELDELKDYDLSLFKDAIKFIKVYIGAPDNRASVVGSFLWSNIDSDTDYEDGLNLLTLSGFSEEEFGFVVTQLPWKSIKEEYDRNWVTIFHPLNTITVDHSL